MSKFIAALYIRVSSEEQAIDGFSISAQLNILTDYCKKNDIEVYKIYTDDGVSAKYSDENKRPQFNQMIKDAGKDLFNIILVHKYDRFARNVELSQRVKREIRQSGVNVISISEPVEDSPIGFITEGLMELLAEYYIKNLSMEVKKGHLQRAKDGYHSGSVPFGYKIDHSHRAKMSINDEQAKIVKYIFDCYTSLGYGINKISKILNESNVLGAVGGKWCPRSIRMLLSNVKYIGMIRLGQNVYQGMHDSIIDKEVFDSAQTILKSHTTRYTYTGDNHSKHYLLGISKCGVCGRAIIIRNSNGRKYYVCSGNRRQFDKVCDNTMTFRVEGFEEYIYNELDSIFSGYSNNFMIVKKESAVSLTEERKKKLTEKLKRFQQLFTEQYITFDEFKAERDKINNELNEIAQMSENQTKQDTIESYRSFWEEAKAYYPDNPTMFRAKLSKLIDSIMISKEEIKALIYAN